MGTALMIDRTSCCHRRSSVLNSCKLMNTNYLDVVYAHDVEFVAEQVGETGKGQITVGADGVLKDEDLAKWGLAPGDEGMIHGPGDEKVLEALGELFKLKKAGKIRAVGFSGTHLSPPPRRHPSHRIADTFPSFPLSAFPLPAMVRLARLSKAHLEPLDIVQSYCHLTLQNTSLSAFLPLFYAAGVDTVTAASPLAMGALRAQGPQPWHPASPATHDAAKRAAAVCAARGTTLERVALGFGFASANVHGSGAETPTVVGLSSVEEVEETVEVWRSVYGDGTARKGRRPGEGLGEKAKEQLALEREVAKIFQESGTYNLGWDSGI